MSMFNPIDKPSRRCKKCKKFIPKDERYSDFYYCKYCDETYDDDDEIKIEDEGFNEEFEFD